MGHAQFTDVLSQVRIYTFEVCETLLFIALAVSLTIHTIRLIISFGRDKK
jgi:hypothetical protein